MLSASPRLTLGFLFALSFAFPSRSQDTPDAIVRMGKDPAQAAVKKEFGPNFRVMETDHFKVISDTSVRCHRISAAVMERSLAEMRAKFLKGDPKPVTVYLIERAVDYERFVSKRGHEELREGFGAYVPKERTVYTHRLRTNGSECGIGTLITIVADPALEADFPKDTPTWFIGAFGAIFEQSRIRNGKLVYGNPAPLRGAELRAAFEGGGLPTLAKFFQIPNASFYDPGGINMAAGRTIMTFMLKLGEDKLAKFVALIRQKKAGAAAMEAATGMKLAELEKRWRDHIANHELGADWATRADTDQPNRAKIIEEGATKFPRYGELRKSRAHELYRQDKMEEAIVHAKAALDDPSFFSQVETWQLIGGAYFTSDPEKAIEAYAKALSFTPWDEHVSGALYRNYANLLKSNARAEEAEKLLAELDRVTAEDAVPGN